MTQLTRLSLANRLIIGLVTLAIMIFGVLSTLALKQELLPSIQAPRAVVTARYTGVSPQIIAKDVAGPIERAIDGISGVTAVSSTSTNGIATITVAWEFGLDTDKLVSSIRSAVDGLGRTLPEQVETDVFTGGTDNIPVLLLAVSTNADLAETARLVKDVAVPDLSAVDGVRQVGVTGDEVQQLAVTLRPKDLRKHDLTAQAVTETVRSQASVVPAGTSYTGTQELAVEVGTSVNSVERFTALPVPTADGPIKLSAVADVRIEAVKSTSLARTNGRPAISLAVLKESDADSVRISHEIAALVPGLQTKIGRDARFTTVFDQAPLVEQSIHDLTVEGLLGLGFAVLIILFFLFSLRSTVITAISIPLSLLVAMIGLRAGGYSLNIFTLAALTVAVGRVVDDSIVVLENIKRRDSGHAALTPADIIASVREVAGAVTASTLTTVAVFLPVATVSGVVGELFRPFATTVAVALVASLLVSMTIVPVLAYWFLRGGSRRHVDLAADPTESDPIAADVAHLATAEETRVTRLQRAYLPVLRTALRHPFLTLVAALVIFVGTIGATTLLKTDFIGSVTDQSTLSVSQKLPAGTRLDTTNRAAQRVEKVLAADPRIATYLTTIGSSLIPGTGSGTSLSDVYITLAPGEKADLVKPDLQAKLDQLRGAGELTVGAANNQSTTSNITVTVKGENAEQLRAAAVTVERELKTVPGLSEVTSDLAEKRNVLKVKVDRTKAAKLGITQAEVGQAVANALRGTQVGTVTLEGEQRDILVRTLGTENPTPADVGKLQLPVSQLQQAKAQEKAQDKIADQQEDLGDEQKAQADQAQADQRAALRKQRAKLADSLSDTEDKAADARKQLAKAKKQLKSTESEVDAANDDLRQAQARLQQAQQAAAVPPGGPPLPASVYAAAQQVSIAAGRVQQLAGGIAQANATIKQLEAGIEQGDAGVTQTRESLDQLDEQIADAADAQARSADQRKRSEKIADEQKALSDVRAKPVTVSDIATVVAEPAPTTVNQIEGTPAVTITAKPEAADLGALTAQLRSRIAETTLPAGVTATLGGAAEDQQAAFSQLGLAMLVALALVFLIMVGTFRSLIQPLILMVSVPFAATGAIAGLLLTDIPLGVPAMVGLLMLIGIVVTNAIVLIDLINQYRRRGEDLQTAIVDGARLRLRPIIMTATATIFALIPMGLGLTGGGAFISRPLAVVVIGGLVSSTILTLLLVPVIYSLVERRGERRRLRTEAPIA